MAANRKPPTSMLRHLAWQCPVIVITYAAGSAILGFGFNNVLFDAVGLTSTTFGYAAGDVAVHRLTSRPGNGSH